MDVTKIVLQLSIINAQYVKRAIQIRTEKLEIDTLIQNSSYVFKLLILISFHTYRKVIFLSHLLVMCQLLSKAGSGSAVAIRLGEKAPALGDLQSLAKWSCGDGDRAGRQSIREPGRRGEFPEGWARKAQWATSGPIIWAQF